MNKVYPIFPTPIYKTQLKNIVSQKDLDMFKNKKQTCFKNEGNFVSRNTHILDNSFPKLKEAFMIHINNYFKDIICTTNKITPYITQSWLNYTEENQHHHHHSHSNSIVSGVFYVSADREHDSIKFYKPGNSVIQFRHKDYNLYNSTSWKFNVETNDLVLFPSSLEHSVEKKKGSNLRISLAFNVFIKGNIGKEDDLKDLSL